MSYTHMQQRRPQVALGELTCWGIDTDEWRKRNTIPIFNNRWNRWLVRVQESEAQSAESAINKVRAQMEGTLWTWFNSEMGVADYVQYSATTSVEAFERRLAADPDPDVSPPPAIRDAAWTTGPTISWEGDGSGVQPWYVEVVFVYRGNYTEFPWPLYRSGLGSFCPKETQCAVYRVYNPDKDKPPAEDPCNAKDSWNNPDCRPFVLSPSKWLDPSEWPWWVWLVGAGGILYFTWPIVLPLVGGAVKTTSRVVGGVVKGVTGSTEAKPNRRRGSKRRPRIIRKRSK